MRALRFRPDGHPGRLRRPKKTVFHPGLNAVAGAVLERRLLRWQEQWPGPVPDRGVIGDGKQRRPGGVERVNAVSGAGRFLGGVSTPAKRHEIPAARQGLGPLDLPGRTVLVEALPPKVATAQPSR